MTSIAPASTPAYQIALQFAHRVGKRDKIETLFRDNISRRLSSAWLHVEFGSSFRARGSEVNADADYGIVIKNDYFFDVEQGKEVSHYWAESRPRHFDLG